MKLVKWLKKMFNELTLINTCLISFQNLCTPQKTCFASPKNCIIENCHIIISVGHLKHGLKTVEIHIAMLFQLAIFAKMKSAPEAMKMRYLEYFFRFFKWSFGISKN